MTDSNGLSGLELAKYVLLRLVNNHDSIERIAEDFDGDKKFILGVVDFLTDIKWLTQYENGAYQMTRNGKTYTINRKRSVAEFKSTLSDR